MKISVDRQILLNAVLNVQKAVSTKAYLSALEGILIVGRENEISLCGYDLELGIKTKVPAEVKEPGEVVINAKILSDIIRKAPSEEISISVDENLVTTIKSNPAVFSITGISVEDYPKLPKLKDLENIEIESPTLKGMIRQTIFATAETDTKPVNTGTLFEIKENELKLISVDGYRLALRKEPLVNDKTLSFVVPGKTLNEILKLLPDSDEAKIQISIDKKHIVFQIEAYEVISRLLEGEFLDYKAAIPSNYTTEIKVNVRNMIDSVDRVSLMVTDRLKSPIRCLFADNLAKISCITKLGKATDEIEVQTEGNALEIGFNNKYLKEALKNSECDEVKIQVNGPLSPLKILPMQGDNFTFLVLPVRLHASEE